MPAELLGRVFPGFSGALWITPYAVAKPAYYWRHSQSRTICPGGSRVFRTGFLSADVSAARRRGGRGALGLTAVLVLGGCSGSGGDPGAEAAEGGFISAEPSSSASPTGSASTSPASTLTLTPTAAYKPATAEGPAANVPLPVMPELAKQESKEGLEAFAEYWYALANYGYETGDLGPIRLISGESCVSCNSYLRVVEGGYRGGDWMTGAEITLQDTNSNFVKTEEGYYQAVVMFLQKDLHFYEAEGFIGTQPGNSSPVVQLIEAAYSPSGWFAIHIETLEM